MLVYMQVEMYGFFFPLVPQPITLTWHVLLLTIVSWLLDCHRGRTGIWLPFQACTWRGSPLRLWGFQLSRPLVLSCFFFMNHLIEVFYVSHCLGVLNITPFTVENSWFFSRLQTGQIIRATPIVGLVSHPRCWNADICTRRYAVLLEAQVTRHMYKFVFPRQWIYEVVGCRL